MAKNTQLPEDYVPALGFSWLTSIYDPVVQLTTRDSFFKQCLIEQSQLDNGMQVLDLASGTGTLSIMIKQQIPGVDLTGIDGDPKIIEIAESKSKKANVRIAYDQGMATSLPYDDASFDRVFSTLFFHHLTREAKCLALSEACRVLKPGGQLHIADWGKPTSFMMRLLFYPIQWLDGFSTTQDNVAGRLPEFMAAEKFENVQTRKAINTVFGTVALYSGSKM
tara:strand:+ start:204 stop:869 length:666 start_codon:yes stop_codon:yes gene_type:complete